MSLSITFKQMLSEPEKAVKEFSVTTLTVSVVLKRDCSIKEPVFVIQTDQNLHDYNYIDAKTALGRYYFITDIVSVANNRWEVHGNTDGLSTWWDQIKTNSAVVKRQQNSFNLYLDDPEFHVYNGERIQTLKFNTQFNKTLSYVLVVNGS